MVALDDYSVRRPVALIRIDVEGAEPQAMRGAERLLREDRPVILSELHPYQLQAVSGVDAEAYLEQMRPPRLPLLRTRWRWRNRQRAPCCARR